MATRMKYKSLENPKGVGEVWKGDGQIAKVTYSLKVQQEILILETAGATDEVEGLKFMTGSISVLAGTKNLWGTDKLTLHMQDGRKVDLFIKSGDPLGGHFRIQPSDDFYK